MNKDFIFIQNLHKYFDEGRIKALQGVNLTVAQGEFIGIMGPSGCGKSTLLHLIGGLDRPTLGLIKVKGEDISQAKNLDEYRAKTVGFIFQLHNLLPHLTALENVLIPLTGQKGSSKEKVKKAKALLTKIGLKERMHQKPVKLSGGERQKVAIARALVTSPEIILADEPTGNLDSKSSQVVMSLINQIWQQYKITVILVTHNPEIASYPQKIYKMLDGRIIN